jgi:ketosteroid isomerase-like protein
MSIEDNRQVVVKFVKAQTEREGRVDESLVTDDCTWWVEGLGTLTLKEQREIVEKVRPHMKTFYQLTPTNTVAEGDQVVAEVSGQAVMKDGRIYKNRYVMIFKLRSGRIGSIKEYYDTKTANDFYADALK